MKILLICTLLVTPTAGVMAWSAEQGPADSPASPQQTAQQGAAGGQKPANEPVDDDDHEDATGSFVEVGDFPKSMRVPGTSFSIKFGGYIKLDMIQSFDAIGNQDEFATSTIPIEGTPESQLGGFSNFHAKESRFYFDMRSPTPHGNARGYIEIDFDPGKPAQPHLRHAYGVYSHLLFGQTWTTFMDISARPKTVDFEGADSSIFIRQALLRWEQPFGKGYRWGVALEDPTPEITISGGLTGVAQSTVPDVVGRIRYDWGKKSHTQIAGIARQIRYASSIGDSTGTGWGFNFTGIWMLGRAKRDSFNWQVSYGEGTARYVRSMTGSNSDAVVAPNGDLQILPVESIVIGYRHFWTPSLRSGIILAIARLDNQPAQAPDAIRETRSPHINLIWSPWHNIDFGGELMWGERTNNDGTKGDATRLHLALKFRFP